MSIGLAFVLQQRLVLHTQNSKRELNKITKKTSCTHLLARIQTGVIGGRTRLCWNAVVYVRLHYSCVLRWLSEAAERTEEPDGNH